MPRTFKVHMHSSISATLTVELSDEKLAEIAFDLEKDPADLTLDDLREHAENEAHEEGVPGLCIHCVGMGYGAKFSKDEDGQWETDDGDNAVEEVTK